MDLKVRFIVSFKLSKSEKEHLPALSAAFEATLQRYLLMYNYHFERLQPGTKSSPLYLIYNVETCVHKAGAVFYLGKLIEAEAGMLTQFDEGVESFSFHVD